MLCYAMLCCGLLSCDLLYYAVRYAVLCCAMLCCAILCYALLFCAMLCCAVLHWDILCCEMLCCAMLNFVIQRYPICTVLRCALLCFYCVTLCCKVQHWAILYCIMLFSALFRSLSLFIFFSLKKNGTWKEELLEQRYGQYQVLALSRKYRKTGFKDFSSRCCNTFVEKTRFACFCQYQERRLRPVPILLACAKSSF